MMVENADLAARSHLFSSTFDSAASGALADSGTIFQSFLLSTTGPGGVHATSGLAQNIASHNKKSSGQDKTEDGTEEHHQQQQHPDGHDHEVVSVVEAVRTQKRKEIVLDSSTEEDFKSIKALIQNLEEIEADTDSFAIPSNERSDYLALFGRVVETILVILAVQHSVNLTRIEASMFVTPLLFMLVYWSSQIKYMITHWTRLIALSRRRINNSEREELIERQRWEREQIEVREIKRREKRSSLYEVMTNVSVDGDIDEDLVLQRQADHHVPKHIRKVYPSHAVYTQAQVRLASSEMLFIFINNILYLVNVYITFLFIKSVLDKINASFSDGIWIMVRATVFILLVLPVYVEFQVSAYRQETVSKTIRLG